MSSPYTPVIRAGDWLVVSGQIGLGPEGLADGFADQLVLILDNMKHLVEGAGATLAQVAKTTVFLTDMADYPMMNEIYSGFFAEHADAYRPARSAICVAGLPFEAAVEVEAWAMVGSGGVTAAG